MHANDTHERVEIGASRWPHVGGPEVFQVVLQPLLGVRPGVAGGAVLNGESVLEYFFKDQKVLQLTCWKQ